MIQIGALMQGTLGGGGAGSDTGKTLTPEPLYSGGEWKSSVWGDEVDYDLPFTGRGVVVSSTSPDNITYTQTGLDPDTFFTTPDKQIRPTGFGGTIIFFQGGIWVYYKDGDADWVAKSLSSIPDANVGGGVVGYIDYANGEFIISKDTPAGLDIAATTNFVDYRIPSVDFNSAKGVYGVDDVPFTIKYIGSNYVAFYELEADGTIQAATSTDLVTWVADSTSLPAPTGSTSQGAKQRPYRDLAYFNANLILTFVDLPDGDDDLKTLHIWSTTNGVDWAEATLTNDSGNEGLEWYVTTAAVELVTATHLFRSTNGTSWVETLPENRLPVIAAAKGDPEGIFTAPDHIAFPYGDVVQEGGKILGFAGVSSDPVLKYPDATATGINVGWIIPRADPSIVGLYTLRGRGFEVSSVDIGNEPTAIWNMYCHNTGDYYFEITVENLATPAPVLIGAKSLGDTYYSGIKETSVLLRDNLVEKNLGDVVVVSALAANQVLGFLFDFVAGTLVISIDGVTLHTATNLETDRAWQPYLDFSTGGGTYSINVGQDAFIHNGTGATAWFTYV